MMKKRSLWKIFRRFGLQGRLGVMLVSLVLITGLTIALIGYRTVHRAEMTLTNELAENISQSAIGEIMHTVYGPVQPLVSAMAQGMFPKARTMEERFQLLPMLCTFLDSYSVIDGAHIGYANGDYLMLRQLYTAAEQNAYGAPPGSVFMLLYIEHDDKGNSRNLVIFYDEDLTVLRQDSNKANFTYDPRLRPWYIRAMKTTGQVGTGPFIMVASEQPAMTFSEKSPEGNAVVGIDIVLTRLSDFLGKIRPTPGTRVGLFQSDGTLLASAQGIVKNGADDIRLRRREDLSHITKLGLQQYEEGKRGLNTDLDIDGQKWVLFLEDLDLAGGIKNFIVLAIPQDEILGGSTFFMRHLAFAALGILILSFSSSWLAVHFIFRPIRELATKAQSMKDSLPDEQEKRIMSNVAEIDALSEAMKHMQANTQKLLSITGTINSEKDFSRMFEHVLGETMHMSKADGGLIMLLSAGEGEFCEGIVSWVGKDGKLQRLALDRTNMESLELMLRTMKGNELVHDSVPRSDSRNKFDFVAMNFEDPDVTEVDVLCAPLNNRMGEKLGIFSLLRKIRSGTEYFQPQQMALIEGLAKTVAIALDNRHLFEKQKALLDAVIQIVAGAIDAKSPYTGGHCARVPILFQMILEAACDAKNGVFEDFSLDDDGWEEARLAAWLHDWGKVTTPEFVMDKATKLETMNDRIHEIRTRFEVLKRDAEISCLRAIQSGGNAAAEQRKLQNALRELDDDFAFVARCNRGDETLEDDDLRRLQQIGSRTWVRTLDKRLGVSRDERARMEGIDGLGLPAIERLLADKSEHLIERNGVDAIAPDNPWGFRTATPQYLYNRGELHNLSIRMGTLTEEERYKINDHIAQTIVMLDKVPLPKHLQGVPEIAGSHHETMDGKGYPRRLVREEMSWGARMMAVADIFEALTASDRPYKSSRTLSEALQIMEEFKRKNHIDEDVYNLFLNADIPRKYGKRCLKPEQNDMMENIPFFCYPAS